MPNNVDSKITSPFRHSSLLPQEFNKQVFFLPSHQFWIKLFSSDTTIQVSIIIPETGDEPGKVLINTIRARAVAAGKTSHFNSSTQSMAAKKGWDLMSSTPATPAPRRSTELNCRSLKDKTSRPYKNLKEEAQYIRMDSRTSRSALGIVAKSIACLNFSGLRVDCFQEKTEKETEKIHIHTHVLFKEV